MLHLYEDKKWKKDLFGQFLKETRTRVNFTKLYSRIYNIYLHKLSDQSSIPNCIKSNSM